MTPFAEMRGEFFVISPRPRRRARPMRAPPAVPAAAPKGGAPSFRPSPCGVNNCA